MGLFSGINNTLKKSEAAVIIQNLLEHHAKAGFFSLDPARYANQMVQDAWNQKPEMFDGTFGQRPHKISIAAIAIASGIRASASADANSYSLVLSLATLMAEIEKNGKFYPFNGIDDELIGNAALTLSEAANHLDSDLSVVDKLMVPSARAITPPENDHDAVMNYYNIKFDGSKYTFQNYKYDKLDDAINYAKLQVNR